MSELETLEVKIRTNLFSYLFNCYLFMWFWVSEMFDFDHCSRILRANIHSELLYL